MAAVEEEDPEQVHAAQILASLRYRKLQRRPEWVLKQPLGEASSLPETAAVATNVMPSGEASSAGTVAAWVPPRRQPGRVLMQPGRVLMQSGEASFSLAVEVPEGWPKGKRSGSRGEASRVLLEQGHAAAAAKGCDTLRSSKQERCAETPAASAQRPVVAVPCYATVAGSGTGPSTSAAPAKEPMKTRSPNSPLDYGAGGSGAPSSAGDAAPARMHAKRKGTSDDEGCSSPAKRGLVAEEEKPMPILVEPSLRSETHASSGKGAPRPFDLNLPCPLDDGDEGIRNL